MIYVRMAGTGSVRLVRKVVVVVVLRLLFLLLLPTTTTTTTTTTWALSSPLFRSPSPEHTRPSSILRRWKIKNVATPEGVGSGGGGVGEGGDLLLRYVRAGVMGSFNGSWFDGRCSIVTSHLSLPLSYVCTHHGISA